MLDAIASRPRIALLRRLDEAPNSSASELVAATGFHLNTVRAHLEELESAGGEAAQRCATACAGPPFPEAMSCFRSLCCSRAH
jgi:DNA-binding transcriptional ArsR family regulator